MVRTTPSTREVVRLGTSGTYQRTGRPQYPTSRSDAAMISSKVPVGAIRGTERERRLVDRIRTLACAGQTDIVIAE